MKPPTAASPRGEHIDMAFNEALAQRIRVALKGKRGLEEKRMFGGVAFMLKGHMCCGVEKDRLMVRVAHDRYEALLRRPHARVMDFTGRPLRGFLFVDAGGCKTSAAVAFWVDHAIRFAQSQPPKKVISRPRR